MKLSKFGQKFTGSSGILQLMDDLGKAVSSGENLIMLGGGNPSRIPELERYFRRQMEAILENGRQFEDLVGNYGPPQGHRAFAATLANLLKNEYGWKLSAENIAFTNGSQTAFFGLFNLLAGQFSDGSCKKILLPLAPEYIGYLDVGLVDDFFVASKPEFEFIDDQIFKYHIDFDAIAITDDIGAICVSRPTNPTGNVLTDHEIAKLRMLAKEHKILLIIDNAYGTPFPNIIFTGAAPVWDENIILCMSLSKLGLPGVRTGIVIANPEIAAAVSGLNAVMSLAPGNFGAVLVQDMVKSGQIIQMSQTVIKPFYQKKAAHAVDQFCHSLAGTEFYIHKPEGAFFLWLWFKGLPITSQELYQRLKQRGVIVVPGQYFFPGIKEAWPHKFECIRVSYAQDEVVVDQGIKIIAQEVKKAYLS